MEQQKENFCFCTLALGTKYRELAKNIAIDLEKYAPGIYFVVGTDHPQDFQQQKNIISVKLYQQGILHCYNDKRIILEKSLLQFTSAIYIDADTKIVGYIPTKINFPPGIVGCYRNILTHVSKYRPQDLDKLRTVANKLNITFESANWIGEALFIVTKDDGKEQEFFATWKKIALYLQLRGMHAGEGNTMGLAAAKVGWQVSKNEWAKLKDLVQHLEASRNSRKSTLWQQLTKKIGYHYRLNKNRLLALKDFNFYYLDNNW